MQQLKTTGIYQKSNKYYTINPESCKNIKVYGENLRTFKGVEYRSWNPFRSKLAAVLSKKMINLPFHPSNNILYLGAATGTTVSHFSDIFTDGWIFAVEPSPIAAKTLMTLIKQRQNIIPVIEDANHPDRYVHLITDKVDFLYQDISQKNQAEIFLINASQYLKDQGQGLFMVKARSIDVSLPPQKAYDVVISQLHDQGMTVVQTVDLAPYEKDHAAIMVTH